MRYMPFVAVVAGAAMLCTGCGKSATPADRDVTVVGTGQVRGAPDTLNADLGVEVAADNVSGAIATVNDRAKAMTDAMVAAGVAREDIRTTDLSIQPQYTPDGHTVTDYRATNMVHVVVRELSKASAVLDGAIKAGGNETRLRGVSFALEDNSKLISDARARAFADAKSRAEQYAVLAGLKLKDVVTINEATSDNPKPQSANAPESFSLEPGTQTVTFTVKVTWALG
ncbi:MULTISPECIES: SIMPL domain-containing protein [unclassified Nocardia]|uniref:SIMPL domain-containing protein n=1 Tax=unclassified Nocardia TaxID=2637762 RepID=UPI001CE3DD56|nr:MULTISPECIES: SIMPL domain-containing protein [unclassified Nocardia]